MRSAAAALLLCACAPALRALPPGAPAGEADEAEIQRLAADVHAKIRLAEHEPDAGARAALAVAAVDEGQACAARVPGSPACDYALALALGVQARERPSTAKEGLKLMVERLRRAAGADPSIDQAGPDRVLALVLLRAPSWPLGPGDPEGALDPARRAVALFPDHPPNQLALAEALLASGAPDQGRAAARRGLELARGRPGDPDAARWIREAERLLGRAGGR